MLKRHVPTFFLLLVDLTDMKEELQFDAAAMSVSVPAPFRNPNVPQSRLF